MRVARTLALDETVVEEQPDPRPGPGEVVCRVLACCTCGSDVQDWYVRRKLPAVLGHELVGEVACVGPGVEAVAPGERVVIHHHAPCGECRRCRRGNETLCERFRSTGLDPGGFAEYVRVEADLVAELLAIGDADPVTAALTEPLGCVLRAQRQAGLKPGDTLLVVGAGASGLLHVGAARARGVEAVWVSEPRHDRLVVAEAWGATAHGREPVDFAMVCTPSAEAVAAAADALAPGGTLCLYAPPAPGGPLAVEGNAVFMRELRVCASWSAGPEDMRAAWDLLAAGAIDGAALVECRFPLEGTGRALLAQKRGEVLKAVVMPHGDPPPPASAAARTASLVEVA